MKQNYTTQNDTREELDDLVAAAYQRWSVYDVTEHLDACEHCMPVAKQRELRRLPVAEIPAEMLWDYNDAAHSDETPPDEIRHFLPRYLELLSGWHEPLIYETALSRVRLQRLPEDDQSFIQEWAGTYARVALTHRLDDLPSPLPEDMLIMLTKGGIDLGGILVEWARSDALSALVAYAELWDECDFAHRRLRSGFHTPEVDQAVMSWIGADDVVAHFMASAERWATAESVPELEAVYWPWGPVSRLQRIEQLWDDLACRSFEVS